MFSYDEPLSGLIDNPCLYSTTFTVQVEAASGEVIEPLYDEAGKYCEAIKRGIKNFHTEEYPTNDLMNYFSLPDSPRTEASIKAKIRSAHVTVSAVGSRLYTKLDLDMAADLTERELAAFTEQIKSQYRDGWGAEFELMTIQAGNDAVFLCLWKENMSFFTGKEFEQTHRENVADGKEKPSVKAKLAVKPVPGDHPAKPKDQEAR